MCVCARARVCVCHAGVYRRSSNTSFLMGQKLIGTNFTQFPFTATGAFGMLTYENNYTSVRGHICPPGHTLTWAHTDLGTH